MPEAGIPAGYPGIFLAGCSSNSDGSALPSCGDSRDGDDDDDGEHEDYDDDDDDDDDDVVEEVPDAECMDVPAKKNRLCTAAPVGVLHHIYMCMRVFNHGRHGTNHC